MLVIALELRGGLKGCAHVCCSEVEVGTTNLDHIGGNSVFVALEVVYKLSGEGLGCDLVALLVGPAVDWSQNVCVHTEAASWYLQVEASHDVIVGHVERVIMDGVDDGSRLSKTHTAADSVATTDPASVDKPDLGLVLSTHLSKHLSVDIRVQGKESFSIASRERRLRFLDSYFSTCNLRSEATDEMVHSLLRVKLRHWGKNSESVSCQENDVLRVTADGWQLHIPDVLQRVAHTGVGSQADIIVVDCAWLGLVVVVSGVLYDSAELDSVINIGFLLSGKTVSFSVATALDVKDIMVSPHVLVITD